MDRMDLSEAEDTKFSKAKKCYKSLWLMEVYFNNIEKNCEDTVSKRILKMYDVNVYR